MIMGLRQKPQIQDAPNGYVLLKCMLSENGQLVLSPVDSAFVRDCIATGTVKGKVIGEALNLPLLDVPRVVLTGNSKEVLDFIRENLKNDKLFGAQWEFRRAMHKSAAEE